MPNENLGEGNNSAKFAFFYMISLVSLLFMALSSGMIIFQIINKTIADVLRSSAYSPELLKFAISALIVAAPVYFVSTYQIHKNLYAGKLHKDSGIRRWLTYAILFVASVVMLGWAVSVINNFLDGELTTRFVLKSVTAIAIAAVVFTFYFYDVRRVEVAGRHDKVLRVYFVGSIIAILAVFTASLFFVETPQETRNRKLDMQVLNDFSVINSAVNNYYDDNEALPENLSVLSEAVAFLTQENLVHPASGQQYEYNPLDDDSYELCADFFTSNLEEENRYDYYWERWPHSSGYACIEQTIDTNGKGPSPVPVR